MYEFVYFFPDHGTCAAPPNIDGVASPIISDGEVYPVGTSINYQCQFGFVSRSSSTFLSTCKFDESTGEAEWTRPDIECVRKYVHFVRSSEFNLR